MKDTIEYKLISQFYKDRDAKRSQVPLMNHINEGLIILDAISATEYAKQAFCIHPLVQPDKDLKKNFNAVAFACSPAVVMLAMEYRNVANAYLSDKINTDWPLTLSPLDEVNDMLVADKVQNRKDFITYHQGTHSRSDELTRYFDAWLDALGIDATTYESLCKRIDASKV